VLVLGLVLENRFAQPYDLPLIRALEQSVTYRLDYPFESSPSTSTI
jgi:hypothetical protein